MQRCHGFRFSSYIAALRTAAVLASYLAPLCSYTAPNQIARGTWYGMRLPLDAQNLALRSAGARAAAMSTAPGFSPDGVLDGDWSAQNWGKGHGWQSAKRHEFPVTLEVRLPQVETIDTLMLATWPAVVHGVNWMGVRNFDVEVEYRGAWARVLTVRANTGGLVTIRLPATPASAVRFVILRANNAEQEDNKNDDEDFARILQIGIYRLGIPTPARGEEVSVAIESGVKGTAAIYRDRLPVDTPHASSPEYLASVFRKAGYGVTFLDSKALYVAGILNRRNFDVFVHPYGAPFPAGTQLAKFLEQGGHLITLGGHPFRRALWFSPEGRLIDGGCELGLTAAVSRVGDYGVTYREQLGMFYNGFERLAEVAVARTAPEQQVVRTRVDSPGSYLGEVAAGLVGERWSLEETRAMAEEGTFPSYAQDAREGIATVTAYANMIASGSSFDSKNGYMFNWPRSRWIPLINGYDRYGRLRGSLVSLVRNYHSPYRGSGWIFSGVSNRDLFTAEHPEFAAALLEALEYLREPAMLRDPQSALACYRQGESAEVAVTVERLDTLPSPVSVRFAIYAEGVETPVFEQTMPVGNFVEPHRRVAVQWKPTRFESDLYCVRITLLVADRPVDTNETGFAVWDPELLAGGPKLDFRENYFLRDGRRALLIGSRTDGIYPHGEVDEDALGVDRQFAMMREFGMQVVSSVYFSGYVPGLTWGRVNEQELIPLQLLRAMDAQVQLAQKHHLIYAPCLFFEGKFMAMENHELTRRICEFLARRYASVPGMMFYIFDDGTAEVPAEEFRKFAEVCSKALNSAGRNYFVMAESGGIALQRYGSGALAFPANGNYTPGVPAFYKLMDRRMAGTSFHLSEFGVNAPGSRPGDYDPNGPYPSVNASGTSTGDYSAYLMEPHLLFGTGGAYVLNWMWKDPAQLLFPWGVTHPNDYTPKEPLFAYRNEGFFLRHFQPVFRVPEVILVCPRERLMRDERAYAPYLRAVIDLLMERNVQFALLDDSDLGKLSTGAHALIYADPQYADKPVLDALLERVRTGDRLFLAGDFTRALKSGAARETSLFRDIAGLSWQGPASGDAIQVIPAGNVIAPYIGAAGDQLQSAGATILAADPAGNAVVAERKLGSGVVFYTADPGIAGGRRALEAFLRRYSIAAVPLTPRLPNRPVFELDRAGGGKIYTLLATRPEGDWKTRWNGPWIEAPESYTLESGAGPIRIPLGTYGVSLVAMRPDQQVDALEGQGRFEAGGSALVESEPHAMIMSLDNEALAQSGTLALFAIGTGAFALRGAPADYIVEAGEFREGDFLPIAEIPAKVDNGMLRFQIDSVQSKLLMLISRRDSIGEARRRMTEALR